MKKLKAYCFAVVFCLPVVAVAQAYKCKKPDGSLSFQDQPCRADSQGSTITLAPSRGEPAEAPEQPRGSGKPEARRATRTKQPMPVATQDGESRRAEEAVRAANEEVKAYNKMQRCNYARRQLGVIKDGGRVYRRDNEGNRNYVDDKDRGAEIAAAEQSVAAECQ
jgi:hypothetical protein